MSDLQKYDIHSQDFKAHAYQTFARLREHDPVVRQLNPDGKSVTWVITRYADADAILRDDTRFVRDPRFAFSPEQLAQAPALPPVFDLINNHMLNKDGADHRRLRGLVNKAFTPRMVEQLRDRIQAIAQELLDQALARGEMDVVEEYAFPLALTVFAELLGIPVSDWDKFRHWSDALMQPSLLTSSPQDLVELIEQFTAYVGQLFAARRQHPQSDLITALLQVEEAGDDLSEAELFSMVVLLIVAGYETTASQIGNAVLALLRHPEQIAMLTADPALMPVAVEELLRYDGALDRTRLRWATEDVEVGGHVIRRGELVIAILGAANRDPLQFDQPDSLEITREANRHLSFGMGAHYCLGAPLARLELEIALNALLQRIPGFHLKGDPDNLTWRNSIVRGLAALPIAWSRLS